MALKHELKEKGIAMNTYEASVSFDELKQNSDGLDSGCRTGLQDTGSSNGRIHETGRPLRRQSAPDA